MLKSYIKRIFNSCCSKADAPVENLVPISRNMINYQLNDPTTPDLVINIPVPKKPSILNFKVHGFDPKNLGEIGTANGRASNVYATLVNSIENFSEFRDVHKWSSTKQLQVYPSAGRQLNAYYDRKNLKFFYQFDKPSKKSVFTADSTDVVAHELGHALLDAIRPDLWNIQSKEIWAFHEAFGDINAIVTVMLYDDMLEYALKETNGDLRKHNVISRLAEEMGNAISNLNRNEFAPGALRNAINNFTYLPPNKLPHNPGHQHLGGEPHNFGRLFVASWYDVLVGIYEHELKNMPRHDALRKARDSAYKYLLRALKVAPNNTKFYNAVASAMVSVARIEGDKHQSIIEKVFVKRKILRPQIKHMSHKIGHGGLAMLLDQGTNVLEGIRGKIIRCRRNLVVRLSNQLGALSMTHNPLYDCEVEVAGDVYYDLDNDGNLVNYLQSSEKEIVKDAANCLDYISENNLTEGEMATFRIVENKIVRKLISCNCGGNCGSNISNG